MKFLSIQRSFLMKSIAIMIISVAGSFTSCEKLDELTKFDMSYESTVTIPGTLGIDTPFEMTTPDITTNSEQEFSGENTNKDHVQEILLKKLTLNLQSPSDSDFSFLKSLTLYIDADGLDKLQIASKSSIPDDVGQTIEMSTTSKDLKEYIFKDKFKLSVEVTTDEMISEDHEVLISSTYQVDATLVN